jgi:hypothetical protein
MRNGYANEKTVPYTCPVLNCSDVGMVLHKQLCTCFSDRGSVLQVVVV